MDFWNLVFPEKCVLCGSVLSGKQRGVCNSCRKKLPVVKEPCCKHCGKPVESVSQEYCSDCSRRKRSSLGGGVALWEYTESMRQVMAQYKYGGCELDARFFADELTKVYGDKITGWGIEVIVPVPLHWRKRWFRGFNQAESLALALGTNLNISVCADAVKRNRYTEPQKKLDDKQRLSNLKNAFSAGRSPDSGQINEAKVLLVDDIYTTGATLEACAGVLHDMGAKKVYFICLCIGRDY